MNRVSRATALLAVASIALGAIVIAAPARPAAATLAPRAFVQVDSARWSSCGVAADGSLWCWGDATAIAPPSWIPLRVDLSGTPLAGKRIAQVAIGEYDGGQHACALATDGVLACWGRGAYGQLGDGTRTDRPRPTAVRTSGTPLAGRKVTKVVAGNGATCAITDTKALACWGSGPMTGTNTGQHVLVPTAVARSGSALQGKTVEDVSLGEAGNSAHGCAVASDGTAACWGANFEGQLGNGTTRSSGFDLLAVAVRTQGTALAGKRFTQISASGRSPYSAANTCARTSDGLAACWGTNAHGQLGNGSTTPSSVPVLVRTAGTALSGKQVRQVLAVGIAACAVTSDGIVACWGANWDGLLGVAGRSASSGSTTPVAVSRTGALSGATVTMIGGSTTICARATDGRLACWGLGASGQLGDGYRTSRVGFYREQAVGVIGTGPFWAFASNTAFVDKVWRDLVGRAPTASERSRWVGDLDAKRTTPAGVVAFLRGSLDATQNVDPAARLYWAYFVRRPDAAGLQYWVGQRRSGVSLQRISTSFASSPEFRSRYGSLSNRQFVDLVYRNVLGRAPDASGLSYWVRELDRGVSRGQVMVGFSESPEYRNRQARSVTAVVLYAFLLRRDITQAELNASVQRQQAGATVAQEAQRVLDSPQYVQRVLDER